MVGRAAMAGLLLCFVLTGSLMAHQEKNIGEPGYEFEDIENAEARAHAERALALHREGDVDGAIHELREALWYDGRAASIYHALNLAYRELDTIPFRARAAAAGRMAVLLEPDNPIYHYELGMTQLERTFLDRAGCEFLRVSELNPDDGKAYYQIGLLQERRYLLRPDYPDDTIYEATRNLQKAIDCGFQDEQMYASACFHLGFLKLEGGETDGVHRTIEEALGSLDPTKELLLLRGAAFHQQGNLEDAHSSYQDALDTMGEADRIQYDGVALLGSETQRQIYLGSRPDQRNHLIRAFWKSLDPTISTPTNERWVEHMTRCFCADYCFAPLTLRTLGSSGPRGLDTDRGRVYVRYGEPTRVDYFFHELWSGRGPGFRGDRWVWFYPNEDKPGRAFRVCFEDHFLRGTYDFPYDPSDQEGLAAFQGYMSRHPTAYYPDFAELDTLSASYAQFRGHSGSGTRVELYWGLRPDRFPVHTGADGRTYVGGVRWIAAYDTTWVTTFSTADTIELRADLYLELGHGRQIVSQDVVELDPQLQTVAIAFQDSGFTTWAERSFVIPVRRFAEDRLDISDIQLAHRVTRAGPRDSGPFLKNGLLVEPQPAGLFSRAHPVYLYFEIYNMESESDGLFRYEASCRVRRLGDLPGVPTEREQRSLLGRLWTALTSPFRPSRYITQSYTVVTDRGSEPAFLGLDLEELSPGKYQVELQVVDAASGDKVEQTQEFGLLP